MVIGLLFSSLAICTALIMGGICWRRRSTPGALGLFTFAVILAIWAGIYLLWYSGLVQRSSLIRATSVLAMPLAASAFFFFILQYTQRGYAPRWYHVAFLAIEPLLAQLLFYRHITLNGKEIWHWLNTIYTSVLLLLVVFILVRGGMYGPRYYRRQFSLALLGSLTPFLINVTGLMNESAFMVSLTPLPFTVTAIALSIGLSRYRLLGAIPLARDLVIEKMGDGWMVLDSEDRIVDLNPAAERLIGMKRDRIFGQPADQVLHSWQNLNTPPGKEITIKGSVQVGKEHRYLQLRLFHLSDGERSLGKVVVWKDITDWQKAEEARRQARDEMFILLHAISGAATRAMSLDDFLTEALFQIAYAFRSQSGAIFLVEESGIAAGGEEKLVLKARHGLSPELQQHVENISGVPDLLREVMDRREVLLIPYVDQETRFSKIVRQIGARSLLILPLFIEERRLGVICLTRQGEQPYRPEEITRLTVIADEIATFIYSDRQRRLRIALSERERLVRDLHDSVSAKLYGLLALTEAAQAGMEAGRTDMPAQVIARIGEQARQAIKELRLFLHELEPIDLERVGLVTAISQRLAAVEGRADVQTRLLADEEIHLPVQTQVALYFIAQEALNNALRHSRARQVTVRIQKRQNRLRFEVHDDGRGFDARQVKNGGQGLRNMRERAAQIGANFKIISAPNQGTKIRVSLPLSLEEEV